MGLNTDRPRKWHEALCSLRPNTGLYAWHFRSLSWWKHANLRTAYC